MATKLDTPEEGDKEVLREKIAQDIRDYLNRGGVVRVCAHGASAYDDPDKTYWGEEPRKRTKVIRAKKGDADR